MSVVGTAGLPVEQIPFPSVTICPNGFHKQKLDNALYEKNEESKIETCLPPSLQVINKNNFT